MTVRILVGDCRDVLGTLPDESVHCVVTSPPYWGLRDYGTPPGVWGGDPACLHEWGEAQRTAHANSVPGPNGRGGKNGYGARNETKWTGPFCARCGAWRGCLGLEPTYPLYVEHMVEVFREVRRVLRADGTLWLNLGDSYATGAGAVGERPGGGAQGDAWAGRGHRGQHLERQAGKAAPRIAAMGPMTQPNRMPQPGLKPKDLCGIPWRVAFALQDDGWWLRQDIIWAKPNPMPESVRDRCTKAHEYLFLLSKSERYYYDADAIKEQATHPRGPGNKRHKGTDAYEAGDDRHRTKAGLVDYSRRKRAETGSGIKNNHSFDDAMAVMPETRNKRSVWTVGTEPFPEAHFATYPTALIEPCIRAGCPPGGMVLDAFFGAGTTGVVTERLQRHCIGIERNTAYAEMARARINRDAPPLFGIAAQ